MVGRGYGTEVESDLCRFPEAEGLDCDQVCTGRQWCTEYWQRRPSGTAPDWAPILPINAHAYAGHPSARTRWPLCSSWGILVRLLSLHRAPCTNLTMATLAPPLWALEWREHIVLLGALSGAVVIIKTPPHCNGRHG